MTPGRLRELPGLEFLLEFRASIGFIRFKGLSGTVYNESEDTKGSNPPMLAKENGVAAPCTNA